MMGSGKMMVRVSGTGSGLQSERVMQMGKGKQIPKEKAMKCSLALRMRWVLKKW